MKKADLIECIQQFADRINRLEVFISENYTKSNYAADSVELLTVEQASEFLHLSIPTLYSKVGDRAIPHIKRSKRLYFDKKELIQYLNDGRKVTANDCINLNQTQTPTP